MIDVSNIIKAISNTAFSTIHNAAFYSKKLCVESKVDNVYRATVGVVQAYPYIALLGVGIGIYCCRGHIKSLVTKVIEAASFLCTKTIESLKSLTTLFKQTPSATESTANSSTPPLPSETTSS